MLLAKVVEQLEKVWPLSGALEWDRVGLVVGKQDAQIDKILFTVDVTFEVLEEAKQVGANLIVSHHPLLFHPVTAFVDENWRGKLISQFIESGIALYAAHTNADVIENGTSDAIAKALELRNCESITPEGIGRVGDLSAEITLEDFAQKLKTIFPEDVSGIRVAGEKSRKVRRIAICAGSGDDLFNEVLDADVYVSSDLRHHPALDAVLDYQTRQGPAIIDVSHWASEFVWLPAMAESFNEKLSGVTTVVSKLRTEPWTFRV